jgi:WD40 repeat protein
MAGADLFLSYNGVDRPAVLTVQRRLEEAGVRTFLDQKNLRPGLPWPQALEEAIGSAAAVAVFLGPNGLGRWQKPEIHLALDWQARASGEHRNVPVIPVLLPGCSDLSPCFLFLNTWIDLRDGFEDAPSLDRLVLALRGEAPEPGARGEIPLCPFRGLDPFREEDAPFFFGREAFVERLLERVRDHRLVAVVGSSGSGKSSVVHAGLIPRLRRQRDPFWVVLSFPPGDDPWYQLAQAIYQELEPDAGEVKRLREVQELADDLRTGRTSLVRIVDRILEKPGAAGRLLLVVDQFEELFTANPGNRGSGAEAKVFVESLLEARKSTRLTLVLTLRADFYGRALSLSRDLSDQVEGRLLNLGRMSPEERKVAIVEPARRARLRFEATLVERILDDVKDEPGELPLLEYALRELWERRDGETLTHAAYYEIGGVSGAISRRAAQEFSQLSPEQKTAARRLLINMVRVPQSRVEESYTRRQVPLAGLEPEQRRVVESFIRAKLLVASSEVTGASQDPGTVTLAHEALIESWDQLRAWLDENAEFLLWQQRVTGFLEEWEQNGRDGGFLLPEARLREAEHWLATRGDDLGEGLKAFLAASRGAGTRRTLAKRLAVLALLLAAAIAFYGWWRAEAQERRADREKQLAKARGLTAQAELARNDPDGLDLSVLLGIEALRRFQDQDVVSLDADRVLRRGLASLAPPVTPPLQHEGRLLSLALSPDGRRLATASQDGTARLWEIATGREIARARQGAPVHAVALSPDGLTLATGGQDGTARLWRNGREIRRFVHEAGLTALAFSADGRLATASADGTARVWQSQTGRELARLQHDDAVSSVVFDPGGLLLLTASLDGTARLWDIESVRERVRLKHDQPVPMAAFSSDGRSIATACQDGTARVWETATGRELARLRHHQSVQALAFNPRGGSLATASHDGTARLWDLHAGREVALLRHERPVAAIAFSPDGRFVATASHDRTARIWEAETGREITRASHRGIVYAVAFSGDGTIFATASHDKTARVWRTPASSPLGPLVHSAWVRDVAFNPASGSLVTAGFDGAVHFWSPPGRGIPGTGWRPARALAHPPAVLSVTVSPNGRWIASGSRDGTARLWEVATGRAVARLEHGDGIGSIDFDPDSKLVATASHDRTARVWSVTTGEELARMPHPERVHGVAFGHGGALLATACEDGVLRLWEPKTGRLLQNFRQGGVMRSVAFNPEGGLLAVGGDSSIRLWRVSREQRLREARVLSGKAHDEGVYDLAFHPRGTLLASGGGDHTAKLWDLATGEQVAEIQHQETVNALAFSPDGTLLATASDDRTVRLWPVSLQDLIKEACAHLSTRRPPQDRGGRPFDAEPFYSICPEQR